MPELSALIAQPEPNTNMNVEPKNSAPPAAQDAPPASQDESAAPAQAEPSEAERIAGMFGWKPEGDWKGDKTGWTDAETYLRTVPKYIGRLQEHNRQSRRELDEVRQRQSQIDRTINHFRDREIAAIRAEYEQAKFRAAEAGDEDLFNRLSKEQADVEARSAPQRQQSQDWDQTARDILDHPAARRFYTTHAWILQDGNEEAFDIVAAAAQTVADRGGTPAQQMRAAEEELLYAYPEVYARRPANGQDQRGNAQLQQNGHEQARDESGRLRDTQTGRFVQEVQSLRRAPAQIANGQRTQVRGDPVQTLISKLPSDAKAAMDMEVKRGHSPEAWLKIFHGTNDLSEIR